MQQAQISSIQMLSALKGNKLRTSSIQILGFIKLQLAQNIIRLEAHSTKKQQAHNTIHSNARVIYHPFLLLRP
jgi:hypothetical protein